METPHNQSAVPGWWIRNRPQRSKVFKGTIQRSGSGRRPLPEDCFQYDPEKSLPQQMCDVYTGLCSSETNNNLRLSLLNGMVKLIQPNADCGYTSEELLYCLSANLTHNLTQIRAASLRAIRHVLRTPSDVVLFGNLQLHYLTSRSLDILLMNEEERVQAIKLIRKQLVIAPEAINASVVRSLISLADSGVEECDRMLRTCLACLCEFGVLNPILLITCGGVNAITRNVLECHSPRIAESLCGVLLHLLEWPYTREMAGVRLDCLATPYCDFTYRPGIMDKNKDVRDLRFMCSRLALLSVLRSWGGTIEFCDPNKPSGLRAIVDVLYLNQLEVRKAVLDLLYELINIQQPVWTDEYSVALAVVDPSDYQDSWRLAEGFVAMEGRSILPSLASRVPNISENHTAFLLYCFLETGLINALVEVIVSSDTFISVRATILLGKLIHMMHTMLPSDISSTCPALPTLVEHATKGNHQARAAITALQTLHQMLKSRPASCSLFLDNIIQSGNIINSKIFKRDISNQDTTSSMFLRSRGGTLERSRLDSFSSTNSTSGPEEGSSLSSKRPSLKRYKFLRILDSAKESERLIKHSNVLAEDDGNKWDWEIITAILRSGSISRHDNVQFKIMKRLIDYFKPTRNRFSHQDLYHGRQVHPSVTAGIDMIDWLLESNELESIRLLTDFFADVYSQLLAITQAKSAHDCLFSPQHMLNTMCQQYIIFIGRMCRSEKGLNILKNTDNIKQLSNIVSRTNHICYIKLFISGLDYSFDGPHRRILEEALFSSKLQAGRLYATQFMMVLLRCKIPNFEVWGLPMLIKQTRDKARCVVLSALQTLDEACHEMPYLEELISKWPNLAPCGDQGRLLMARFYSTPRGLNHPKGNVVREINDWVTEWNKKYVLLLEADTHATMTLHMRNEEGSYSRRVCSARPNIVAPYILPHLYGQLVQTSRGLTHLQQHGDLPHLIEILTMAKCNNDREVLELKSALWALGHMSTSTEGVEFLDDPVNRVYEKIVILTKHCGVYSVRSTAFNVICLIGSTISGANVLLKFDWVSVRHERTTWWPICEPEDWISKHLTPMRHQLDDVRPYNYTGIDENITEFLSTSEHSNSFYFDELGDSSRDEADGVLGMSSRAKTLPGVVGNRSVKHTRSLSESKTSDGINIYLRTRFNSGTDSNTSGVGSSESVYGKNLIGDLQQTLSPIPSTSNLLDSNREDESFRRSSWSNSAKKHFLSPQDIQGYATFRSLRRHCRPVVSESAADELADIIAIDIKMRSRKLLDHRNNHKLHLKKRGYEQHYNTLSPFNIEQIQSPNLGAAASLMSRLHQNDSKGPCYAGYSFPKNLLELFPQSSSVGTYVSRCTMEPDNNLFHTATPKQLMADSMHEGDESTVSSMSDLSSNSKRTKWIGKHNKNSCLNCCRPKDNRPSSENMLQIHRQKHFTSLLVRDISFSSPESIYSEESIPDRITSNILRHVQRMANPVCSRQSKIALLGLKQRHPGSFQDVCLYSEVCKSLARNTYRLNARRTLQELFLDLNFSAFYNEPIEILNRVQIDQTLPPISTTFNNKPKVDREKLKLCPLELHSVIETSSENISVSIEADVHACPSSIRTDRCRSSEFQPPFNNQQKYERRPRFNTFELDLSCTKNKFPITEKRKILTSPTTPPPVTASHPLSTYGQPPHQQQPPTPTPSLLSPTTPTSSLFCEKRMQTSKSDATLAEQK